MAVVGSPVVGDLPKTGIFREAEVDQVTTIEDFLKDADQWHQDLVEFLLSLFPLFLPLASFRHYVLREDRVVEVGHIHLMGLFWGRAGGG